MEKMTHLYYGKYSICQLDEIEFVVIPRENDAVINVNSNEVVVGPQLVLANKKYPVYEPNKKENLLYRLSFYTHNGDVFYRIHR